MTSELEDQSSVAYMSQIKGLNEEFVITAGLMNHCLPEG